MPNGYDLVLQLTSGALGESDLRRNLRDFAHELGWRPSYNLVEHAFVGSFANAHLVVEHGLEPDAVITFLDKSTRLADLQVSDHNRLMEISYNNLADWHLYVEPETVTYCFNRTQPQDPTTYNRKTTDFKV